VQRLTPDGMSVQIFDLGQDLRDAAISAAGDQVAFTDGRTLRMWDVEEAAEVWHVSYRAREIWNILQFSSDDALVMRLSSFGQGIEAYRSTDGQFLNAFSGSIGYSYAPLLVASQEGLLIRKVRDSVYRWFDPYTGSLTEGAAILDLHTQSALGIGQMSPDGDVLAYAGSFSGSHFGALTVYSFAQSAAITLIDQSVYVFDVKFIEPSSVLVTRALQSVDRNNVELLTWWDVTSLTPVQEREAVGPVYVNPDSHSHQWTLHISFDTVTVIDRQRSTAIATLMAPGQIQDAAVSPDGRLLVTGGCDDRDYQIGCYDENGLLTFWDTSTWKEVGRLHEPYYAVSAVGFSPDGAMLAVASDYDGVVRLFAIAPS
jgi:WD40 repeat protein